MSFEHLPEIEALIKLADQLGLASKERRPALLAPLGGLGDRLETSRTPVAQLAMDLHTLNGIAELEDGKVPLRLWLREAIRLVGEDKRADELKRFLAKLSAERTPRPTRPTWAPPSDLPEYKEAVIQGDDRVPFPFLAQGHEAGKRVARVRVPRFENHKPSLYQGTQLVANGTGWVIGPGLLVTALHVVMAREPGETEPDEDDLGLQVLHTTATFDHDSRMREGTSIDVAGLVASDHALDYAVLRLTEDPGVAGLRLAKDSLEIKDGVYPPVNIIQHPNGGPKMIAVRHNLATDAGGDLLRYFTPTDPGASGAPVFHDTWAVVALHRMAAPVPRPVKNFEGRRTAYLNQGTSIGRIQEDLQTRYPELWREIISGGHALEAAAQPAARSTTPLKKLAPSDDGIGALLAA
jgi:endonuclease G